MFESPEPLICFISRPRDRNKEGEAGKAMTKSRGSILKRTCKLVLVTKAAKYLKKGVFNQILLEKE